MEVPGAHIELTEPGPDRGLVQWGAAVGQGDGDPVQERVVGVPRVDVPHGQPDRGLGGAGRARHRGGGPGGHETALVLGHRHRQRPGGEASHVTFDKNLGGDLAGGQGGGDEHLGDPGRGDDPQIDGPDDAAEVVAAARPEVSVGGGLVAVRGLVEDDAVDALGHRVQHPHREQVAGPVLDRGGDVERERAVAALVTAHGLPVDPHGRGVVDRLEGQQQPVGAGPLGRGELAPVPGQAVVLGQDLLDDPGHRRRLGWPGAPLGPGFGSGLIRSGRAERPALDQPLGQHIQFLSV